MATDVQTRTDAGAEPSVGALIQGIIHDVQELTKQQLAMFRAETQEDMRKSREAALPVIVGLLVCFVGVLILGFALAHLVAWAFPQLPLWAAYAIMGALFAGVGVAATVAGWKKFQSFNPLPDKTLDALKENVEWLTKAK